MSGSEIVPAMIVKAKVKEKEKEKEKADGYCHLERSAS